MFRHHARRNNQQHARRRRTPWLRRSALFLESLEPRIVMDGQTEIVDSPNIRLGLPVNDAPAPVVVDDHFDVFPGHNEQVLDVLANDAFGYAYGGERRISEVGAASGGGAVRVGPDDRSLLYTPAADFSGEETFTYTVDGDLSANVRVDVNAASGLALPKFGSTAEFKQFVIDEGLRRYKDLFGASTWNSGWSGCWEICAYDAMRDVLNLTNMGAPAGVPRSSSESHSETNVQVAGVDEGDLVETDGDYLYILHGGELVIASATPEMKVTARVPLRNSATAEYLYGNRLTVISSAPMTLGLRLAQPAGLNGFPWNGYASQFVVTVFDVADREHPTIVQETKLDGSLVESRAIGNYVYLVVRQGFNFPELEQHCPPVPIASEDTGVPIPITGENTGAFATLDRPTDREFPGSSCTYETRDEFVRRMQDTGDAELAALLPHYTSFGPDGAVVGVGLLDKPADMFRPTTGDATNLLSLVTIDVVSDSPGPKFSTGLLGGNGEQVYASIDNLCVLGTRYDYSQEAGSQLSTSILKFAIDRNQGSLNLVAAGDVAGQILNQFSVDEHDGFLRIATTSNTWGAIQINQVFVLQQDGQRLAAVGAVDDLAPGERIYAVRFAGDIGYVVTFVELDPLFVIDLADPTHPRVTGELEIPGFSDYLQPLDANHLLAIGRGAENVAFSHSTRDLQLSLFDVSDANHPVLVDRYSFAGGIDTMFAGIDNVWRGGQALDQHAFGFFADSGTLAIPIHGQSGWAGSFGIGSETPQFTGDASALVLFHVDAARGFTEIGRLEHESRVRRSAMIGDRLYSIADTDIQVVGLDDPQTVIDHLDIGPPAATSPKVGEPGTSDPSTGIVWPQISNVVNGDPGSTADPTRDPMQRMIERAIQDLANEQVVDDGQVMFVAADAVVWIDDTLGLANDPSSSARTPVPGFRIELEMDDRRFVYHSDSNDAVALASLDGAALNGQLVNFWFNQDQPTDADGDHRLSPRDILVRLNDLNANGPRALSRFDGPGMHGVGQADGRWRGQYFLDANNDFYLSAIDALIGINLLNERFVASSTMIATAEGEAATDADGGNGAPGIVSSIDPIFARLLADELRIEPLGRLTDGHGSLATFSPAEPRFRGSNNTAFATIVGNSTRVPQNSESLAKHVSNAHAENGLASVFEREVDRILAAWSNVE